MKFLIKNILFILPFLIVISANAQDDCTVKLQQAEKLYEEGRIEKVPDLIDNCIESGFNKENKIRALRLLTLVYLYEDRQDEAEETILKLLKIDPEYQINRNVDPIEFIRLHSMFNTESVFSLGVVLGGNFTTPRLIETYSGTDFDSAGTNYSSNGIGFAIGLKAIYHLNENIEIVFEPKFSQQKFMVSENTSALSVFGNASEVLSYIDLPLLGSYYFYEYRDFQFFADLGFSYSILVAGKMDGQINGFPDGENQDTKGSSIVTKEFRKPYLASGIVGVGLKYNLKRDNFHVNLRYNMGFNNIIIEEESNDYAYSTDDYKGLVWDYHYVDNNFSLSNFSILISYNHEFYIHSKKK